MNKERRERLFEVEAPIEEAKCIIRDIIDEEQDAYDNLPPSLQDAERGLFMQDAIEALEELDSELDGFLGKVHQVIEKLTPCKSKKK